MICLVSETFLESETSLVSETFLVSDISLVTETFLVSETFLTSPQCMIFEGSMIETLHCISQQTLLILAGRDIFSLWNFLVGNLLVNSPLKYICC